ncbi:hypothetical protein [Hyphomicrobium sp. MC8b]|uniref:hypothetical protein n=1 Tax=Hyphomicrobium sp. MC8b TaxID=300273 RepID=UPI00391C20D9
MPFDLNIPDALTQYLNAQALNETRIRLESYAADLLQEASRLETTSSAGNGEPQITSSMIADADLLLRRGYRQGRPNYWLIAGKIISPIGALATGFFTDAEKLKQPLMLAAFIILLIVTVTATVLVVVKE